MQRPDAQRGSVTAEIALALPAVMVVLVTSLVLTGATAAQLGVAEAARAGARGAALGQEDAQVRELSARVAGSGAVTHVRRDPPWVEVTVERAVGWGWLAHPSLTASASATARVEP